MEKMIITEKGAYSTNDYKLISIADAEVCIDMVGIFNVTNGEIVEITSYEKIQIEKVDEGL